jgi:hypothetical protein
MQHGLHASTQWRRVLGDIQDIYSIPVYYTIWALDYSTLK